MKKHLFVCILCLLVVGFLLISILVSPAKAMTTGNGSSHVWVGTFLDQGLLKQYNSVLTGNEFVYLRDHYGIPIVDAITILKIETNLGAKDEVFTKYNNFGCVVYFPERVTLMGTPVPGTFVSGGHKWFKWVTPQQGMVGWGRFVQAWNHGTFLKALKAGDWKKVAETYNGKGPNAVKYAGWCKTLFDKYTKMFKDNGYPLTAAGYTP